MSRRILLSSSVTKFIATPFLPKRPPRPILHKKKSTFPHKLTTLIGFKPWQEPFTSCCSLSATGWFVLSLQGLLLPKAHLGRKNHQCQEYRSSIQPMQSSSYSFGCKKLCPWYCHMKSQLSLPSTLPTAPTTCIQSQTHGIQKISHYSKNQIVPKSIQTYPVTWNSTLSLIILIQFNCFQ